MQETSKFKKVNPIVFPFLFLFLLSLLIGAFNENYANVINQSKDPLADLKVLQEDLTYTFKVADKLVGKGDIKLLVNKGQITGTACGIGMTSIYDVDFHTIINGTIDKSNSEINVNVSGEGDPLEVPIPGKISFHGPLKGFLDRGKLNLIGSVHINGILARYAGFKKTEDLVIEIEGPSLVASLASL